MRGRRGEFRDEFSIEINVIVCSNREKKRRDKTELQTSDILTKITIL